MRGICGGRSSRAGLRAAGVAAAALLPTECVRAQSHAYLSNAFAVSGEPAHGAPDNLKFFSLFVPNLDLNIGANGQVLTHIPLIDASIPAAEVALYTGKAPSQFIPVMRGGLELPGNPGVFPKLFGTFVVNSSDAIVVTADLQGPGTTTNDNIAVLMGSSATNIQIVARKGELVPNTPGNIFRSMLFPGLNDSGLLTFGAVLGGSGTNAANDSGVYFRRPGNTQIERLVREGDPTPDTPTQVFGQATLARLNNAGQLLLNTGLAGLGIVENANDHALWYGNIDAPLVRIMQTGTQARGLAPGINYTTASNVTLARDGQIAFSTTLGSSIPGLVTASNDAAIFAGDPGAFIPVLREGDSAPVPGSPNARFSGNPTFHFSSGGNVVIASELTGAPSGSDGALFAGTSPQDLKAIAVTGRRAPGTPPGTLFRNPSGSNTGFERPAVNAHGQAAFIARVGTNTLSLTDALYLYDPEQGLILVARQGGTIELRPGELRTISDLGIAQPGNGQTLQGGPFNDEGTLVFQATFSDGNAGIFTASVPLVGDVNLDKVVSFSDFQALERGFGAAEATRAIGDLNGDLAVDFADFMLLRDHFGESTDGPAIAATPTERAALEAFAAAHVPEPGTTWTGVAAAGWALRRSRQARRRR